MAGQGTMATQFNELWSRESDSSMEAHSRQRSKWYGHLQPERIRKLHARDMELIPFGYAGSKRLRQQFDQRVNVNNAP